MTFAALKKTSYIGSELNIHSELGVSLYYIRTQMERFIDARRVNARVRVGISLPG